MLTELFEAEKAALLALGFSPDDAAAEAARTIRLTTGDCYFGRTDDELAEMARVEADGWAHARRTAGVCEEFPAGEFAVAGFNTGPFWEQDDEGGW